MNRTDLNILIETNDPYTTINALSYAYGSLAAAHGENVAADLVDFFTAGFAAAERMRKDLAL
ncbi:hypothetical protein [Corynebacterium liangguodongii]|uniref:Uncharacterized protein n=1 Tax=Corynebacterium liangguodongii TaxID=2079535 RepID=A0A2S0WGB6_9CORY|nr:hypothetical protein [Corynebacterium liangguodongii]AWB84813.1 hypothetical protein C3E79_10275 [Corynebacterium liangguodongii]PWB99170.1 hypothetical protein DF219_07890 [Corynebacterium liangguodongii]